MRNNDTSEEILRGMCKKGAMLEQKTGSMVYCVEEWPVVVICHAGLGIGKTDTSNLGN